MSYMQGMLQGAEGGGGGLPGQAAGPGSAKKLVVAPASEIRNVADSYLDRVLNIRQAFRRNLRHQVVPAPSVAPDFRTKARAEADRAFDEMTRLAAEEAERVTVRDPQKQGCPPHNTMARTASDCDAMRLPFASNGPNHPRIV